MAIKLFNKKTSLKETEKENKNIPFLEIIQVIILIVYYQCQN